MIAILTGTFTEGAAMTDADNGPPLTHGHYADRVEALVERVTLRDGTQAWVGPLLRSDREDLAREYQTLSFASKRHRFLSAVRELTPGMLDHLVDEVDGVNHVAWVLFAEQDGGMVPAGIGRIVRYPEQPDTADVAVTVKDEWQGRGVATALMPILAAHRPPGVTHVRTEIAEDNPVPLKMLRRAGATRIQHAGSGVLDVEVDLTGEGLPQTSAHEGQPLHGVLDTTSRQRLRTRDRHAGL